MEYKRRRDTVTVLLEGELEHCSAQGIWRELALRHGFLRDADLYGQGDLRAGAGDDRLHGKADQAA